MHNNKCVRLRLKVTFMSRRVCIIQIQIYERINVRGRERYDKRLNDKW
jgi:hypothetical protein